MRKNKKRSIKNLWKALFVMWIFFWLLFLIRGFVKGEFKRFKALSFATASEKKSYVLGENLYEFLVRCEKEIPVQGTYEITGELTAHNKFRLVYYLYPRTESDDPDYTLKMDKSNDKYILRKRR